MKSAAYATTASAEKKTTFENNKESISFAPNSPIILVIRIGKAKSSTGNIKTQS